MHLLDINDDTMTTEDWRHLTHICSRPLAEVRAWNQADCTDAVSRQLLAANLTDTLCSTLRRYTAIDVAAPLPELLDLVEVVAHTYDADDHRASIERVALCLRAVVGAHMAPASTRSRAISCAIREIHLRILHDTPVEEANGQLLLAVA